MSENVKVDRKWLEKVTGLFNLADNNPNENEALAAMAKAQEMMIKRGITEKDLKDFKSEKISEGTYTAKDVVREMVSQPEKPIPVWKGVLANIIAKNFRCFCVRMSVGRGYQRLEYTGLEEDMEIAVLTLNYAMYCIVYNSEIYMARRKREEKSKGMPLTKKEATGIQNDYMMAFCRGLEDKLRQQVEANNWGLVLVKDQAVIKAHEARTDLRQSNRSYASAGDIDAKHQGYKAGNSFKQNAGHLN